MKKFLLLSTLFGISVPVLAQVNNNQVQWGIDNTFAAGAQVIPSDMPTAVDGTAKIIDNIMPDGQPIFDVNPFEDRGAPAQPIKAPVIEANPTPASGVVQGGGLFPELGNTGAVQEKRGSEAIKLIIDDVSIVQPALNGHAFCIGTLTMENNLNIRVQKMDLVLNYGGLDVPVNFANVSPLGGKQTQDIAWLGEFCNSMLSIPQITVKSCVASTLSREQCQSKIEYQPIESK